MSFARVAAIYLPNRFDPPRPARSLGCTAESMETRRSANSAGVNGLIDPEVLQRENRLLRARISRLSAASLRISATLDLKTVIARGSPERPGTDRRAI